jgi:streptogramin lyase
MCHRPPRARLALLAPLLAALAAATASAQSRTYTTDADFDEGFLANVNHDAPNGDQLQLNAPQATSALPFIAIAATARGTLVRLDSDTGQVLGEYRTAPLGRRLEPSRTSVDAFGNVWVGNMDEDGGGHGSVVKIGVVVGGTRVNANGSPNPTGEYLAPPFQYSTCVDRDGDGLIHTSHGLGNILAWPDVTDGAGGADGIVQDAVDECILVYQRTSGPNVRHVSLDASNDVWAGAYPFSPSSFDHIDGDDGAILQTFAAPGCGGFNGLVDGAGVLWSASFVEGRLLRYVLASGTSACIPIANAFATAIDGAGNVWVTQFDGNAVVKVLPNGTVAAGSPFSTGGASIDRGVAVTPADGHVWVANSAGTSTPGNVSRLDNNGTLLKVIPLGADGVEPTGIAVDLNGKVWVTCRTSSTAKRIDPTGGGDGLGAVDLTIALGQNAGPENYGDTTGVAQAGLTGGQGFWDVVFDGGATSTPWGTVRWTAQQPAGTSLAVQVRAADAPAALGGRPFVPVQNGVAFAGVNGRYIEIRVDFRRPRGSAATPVLFDLTVEALGGGGPEACRPGQRRPGSLLVYPEFDNRFGSQTLLTVTNSDALGPAVDVELVYVGREGAFGQPVGCLEFNDTVTLTPNDTLTLITSAQDPDHARGYVYAFAKRFGQPIVHDHLSGSLRIISGLLAQDFQVNPFVHLGIGAPGSPTDADHDGIRDLDDVEYSCSPDELLVPRFLAQQAGIQSELVLINLTGGGAFTAIANLLVYNDNEEVFSASHQFSCWEKIRLSQISNVFLQSFLSQTHDAPNEIVGATRIEAGWFRIDGSIAFSTARSIPDPALLGYLTESIHGRPVADLPFETGAQQNGDLLPQGPFGDL